MNWGNSTASFLDGRLPPSVLASLSGQTDVSTVENLLDPIGGDGGGGDPPDGGQRSEDGDGDGFREVLSHPALPVSVPHWWITDFAIKWIAILTEHHHLHAPEHVGMFAGSLLPRSDWDHP